MSSNVNGNYIRAFSRNGNGREVIQRRQSRLLTAETVLCAFVFVAVVCLFLTCSGCTAAQIATAKSDASKIVSDAQIVLQAVAANEATIDQVAAKVASLDPKLAAPINKVLADYQEGKADIPAVQTALTYVAISLSAQSVAPVASQ